MERHGRIGAEAESFGRFCLVGGLGFAVDAGCLMILLHLTSLGPLTARIASILLALTVTWAMHRRYTFASRDPARLAEWSRFAAVNGVGALLNFAIYSSLLLVWPVIPPLLALAVASAFALAANYAGSKRFAFRDAVSGSPRDPGLSCP